MKEFSISELLSLKLEEKETYVYVKGKRFLQCMFLLIEIPVKEISSFDEIDSIDEASGSLEHSEEGYDVDGSQKIPPAVEFWGHCSNLQVWYENNYDTRLLHRNLAFPLLRELTDAGDPLAKRVFREEIAHRLESGYLPVISYLLLEDYVYYLSDDYFEAVGQSQEMIDILFKAVESKDSVLKFVSLYLFHRLYYYLVDNKVQKFVDFIKQDEEYVRKIFFDPVLLTNAWIYYRPSQLYSIRVALILDIIREQCDGGKKIGYEDLKWIPYLEEIIYEMIISKTSLTHDYEQKISSILIKFLKNAYDKYGKLTKEMIGNCVRKIEEIIKKGEFLI